MIYLIILPLSRIKIEALSDVNSQKKISPEIEQVQDQFSNLLTNSNVLGKNLTEKLASPLDENVCISHELVFSPKVRGQNNWLIVTMLGEKTRDNPLQKKAEITFESSSRLSDEIKSELEKYKFALYLYRKSGHDLMSWRGPFKDKHFYQYSLELNPDDVHKSPNQDFKETIRRNYIDEKTTPDGTYFLLVFREDLLLIYDY